MKWVTSRLHTPSWATASDSAPFSLGTRKAFSSSKIPPPPLPGCPSSPGFPSLPRTGSVLGFPLYSFLPGLSLLLGSEERSEFGATVQGVQWELGMGVRAEDGRKGQRLNWKKGPAGKLGTARLTSSSPTPSPSTRFRLENLQGKRFAASNTSPQRLGSPSWS